MYRTKQPYYLIREDDLKTWAKLAKADHQAAKNETSCLIVLDIEAILARGERITFSRGERNETP